jgi:hypothetical protein
MALSILDGTQTATTLSTILSSGQHITAHTVVSLGTQAKTDILSAVSSGIAISGTVTVGVLPALTNNTDFVTVGENILEGFQQYGTVPASLSAGTAQIGSVTASISNFPITQAVSVDWENGAQGLSGLIVNNYPIISSTAITSGSFSSLTSATLVPGNTVRKMATVFNQGAGQLFVNAGATATTLGGGFMVALSSGDYFECGFTTTTLSALFASAGTASWVSH